MCKNAQAQTLAIGKNKTEHAVQSYAAGKGYFMASQIHSASAMQYKFFLMPHNANSCKAMHNADAEKCKG